LGSQKLPLAMGSVLCVYVQFLEHKNAFCQCVVIYVFQLCSLQQYPQLIFQSR